MPDPDALLPGCSGVVAARLAATTPAVRASRQVTSTAILGFQRFISRPRAGSSASA